MAGSLRARGPLSVFGARRSPGVQRGEWLDSRNLRRPSRNIHLVFRKSSAGRAIFVSAPPSPPRAKTRTNGRSLPPSSDRPSSVRAFRTPARSDIRVAPGGRNYARNRPSRPSPAPILADMSPLSNRTVATIGSGVMAESIIAGLLRGKLVEPKSDRRQRAAGGAARGAHEPVRRAHGRLEPGGRPRRGRDPALGQAADADQGRPRTRRPSPARAARRLDRRRRQLQRPDQPPRPPRSRPEHAEHAGPDRARQ
jgi:hypothetical protein